MRGNPHGRPEEHYPVPDRRLRQYPGKTGGGSGQPGHYAQPASDADGLKTSGNIWSMLAGISVCDDNMPFIWTRNLKTITKEQFNVSQDQAEETDFAQYLDPGEKPFSDEQVVLARKGASFQVIKRKDLTAATFLSGSTNSTVEVVAAIAGEAEQGEKDF